MKILGWVAYAVALSLLCAAELSAQTGDRRLSRSDSARGERRVALVVGNDAYAAAPLKNAVADARAMARALRELGFGVTLLEDATRAALTRAVAQVGDALGPNDAALFFFAGHGVQLAGENYLIPVDFAGDSATAARLSSLGASEIQEVFGKAKISLLLLDACRNNPFTSQRSGGSGLAPMEGRGSLVAFATGAGRTASDNVAGQNGLFTRELLTVLKEQNLSARDVFYRVRQRVHDASNGQQIPAVYDGLLGDFVFRAAATGAPGGGAPGLEELARREELALWDAVKDSRTPASLEEYLRQYPNGRFRVAARERLEALRSTPPPAGGTSAKTDADLVFADVEQVMRVAYPPDKAAPFSCVPGTPSVSMSRDGQTVKFYFCAQRCRDFLWSASVDSLDWKAAEVWKTETQGRMRASIRCRDGGACVRFQSGSGFGPGTASCVVSERPTPEDTKLHYLTMIAIPDQDAARIVQMLKRLP